MEGRKGYGEGKGSGDELDMIWDQWRKKQNHNSRKRGEQKQAGTKFNPNNNFTKLS